MRVAIEGCCHGELDKIYATMAEIERAQNMKIDLLICCGDFQAIRNLDDLECLACPPKYRRLGTFHKYYSGQAVAPYPTLFIGGNHEASNHLWELYYGGWVAPRIYYLGHAGVINFGDLRIAGLSGIYNSRHYRQGHFERPPYSESSMRSAYHERELEVYRLMQIQQPLDVMLSHDWPQGIAYHGNIEQLYRKKGFLRPDIESGRLGSPPAWQLLQHLQPNYWFSAHHHVKYPALIHHPQPGSVARRGEGHSTQFLALGKCVPGGGFLQVVDFPAAKGPMEFAYDEEWLAILHSTHTLLSVTQHAKPLPGMGGARSNPSAESLSRVQSALETRGGASIPENFERTAPTPQPGARRGAMPRTAVRNPQTEAFLQMLGLAYNLDPPSAGLGNVGGDNAAETNPEEIVLDETVAANPEEIDLDDDADANLADDLADVTPGANPEEIDLENVYENGLGDESTSAVQGLLKRDWNEVQGSGV